MKIADLPAGRQVLTPRSRQRISGAALLSPALSKVRQGKVVILSEAKNLVFLAASRRDSSARKRASE